MAFPSRPLIKSGKMGFFPAKTSRLDGLRFWAPHVPGGAPVSAPEREMRLQHLAVVSGMLVSARPVRQLQGSGVAVLVEGSAWGWKLEDIFTSQCQRGTLNRRGHRVCGACSWEAAIPIPCVHSCVPMCV